MKLEITTYGTPILREKAEAVPDISDEIRQLSDDMHETMLLDRGIGLAAQQVNKTIQICTIELPPEFDVDEPDGKRLNPDLSMPLTLVNPVIKKREGMVRREEGCLSFPKIFAPVSRAYEIQLSYLDLNGNEIEIDVRGMLARVIQHELDHLKGILFVDKIPQIKKISLSGKLKKLKHDTEKQLGITRHT